MELLLKWNEYVVKLLKKEAGVWTGGMLSAGVWGWFSDGVAKFDILWLTAVQSPRENFAIS